MPTLSPIQPSLVLKLLAFLALPAACSVTPEVSDSEGVAIPGTISELTRCPEHDACTPGAEQSCDETTARPGAIIPCIMREIVFELGDGEIGTCQAYANVWEMCHDETPTTWSSSSPICPDSECNPGDVTYCENGQRSWICSGVAGAAVDEDGNPYFCIKGVGTDIGTCEDERRGNIKKRATVLVDTYTAQLWSTVDERIPPGVWRKIPVERYAKSAIIHLTIAVGKYDTGISFTQPAGAAFTYVGPTIPNPNPFIFPEFGKNYGKTIHTLLDADGNAWFLNDTRAPAHLRFDIRAVVPGVLP